MGIQNIFAMLGGLALFLYGMSMMSDGLEQAAGNKMKVILEKLTSNRFLGVAVGALITAVIQSSSATTVMVVGFVNSGLMKLENAVWIIMGANIGTTITGQLVALDVGELAPIIAFIGVALITFIKNKKIQSFGLIAAGLGILFMGMESMSGAMAPLRDVPEFVNLMTKFSNPVLGIAFGALFTAVIQSSSASVGILQALAMSGAVTLDSALYILFGQNIGTCITAVLAAFGTSKNAKRTTVIHLSFNMIGTIIFVIISFFIPLADIMKTTAPGNVAAQIANTHTVFNIVTTVLLLPIGQYLVKLATLVLPDKPGEDDEFTTKYLDFSIFDRDFHIGTKAIVGAQLFNETQNMLAVTRENVARAFKLYEKYDEAEVEKIQKYEEYINDLNRQIRSYTTKVITAESDLTQDGTPSISYFLRIANDIERIGDHAVNIANYAGELNKEERSFSEEALKEIDLMNSLSHQILSELNVLSYDELKNIVDSVDVIEDSINATTQEISMNQISRLKAKKCHSENSILFAKVLTDFERIGDHGLNVAKHFLRLNDVAIAMKMKEEAEAH